MKIDFLTIFPELIQPYMEGSIMKRAHDAGAVDFDFVDIRDYTLDKHRRVDDTPYGGGAGMVMRVEPIFNAVESRRSKATNHEKTRIILLSAKGPRYTQRDAERLCHYDRLIFICGRYEGVDERVAQNIADEELSIGDYVLTGGELGAMVIADSVVRLLPDVLGNDQSIIHESHAVEGYCEHPQYTKPEEFNGWGVPDVLMSGNHQAIDTWRMEHSKTLDDVHKKE